MKPITKFDCKVRKSASGQTIITVPVKIRDLFREDHKVSVEIYDRPDDQTLLTKKRGVPIEGQHKV